MLLAVAAAAARLTLTTFARLALLTLFSAAHLVLLLLALVAALRLILLLIAIIALLDVAALRTTLVCSFARTALVVRGHDRTPS